MDILAFPDYMRSLAAYQEQIVHEEVISPQSACYEALARPLLPELRLALERAGITRFYSHQAQAINAVRDGQHIIVATSTASGKTLCYQAPLLEAAIQDPLARALCLFPTKALTQDQLRSLEKLIADGALSVSAGVYDGDTMPNARTRARRQMSILLSNPDMLHLGILPNHSSWAAFFRHLKYVVVDEAHAYRGVLGSHVACVLRRLRRVCALYGSEPQFILCSATIANPGEHGERLTGYPMQVVDQDGAPHGPRRFLLWNPPLEDKKAGARKSVNSEATLVFTELVKQELRSIAFVKARKVAELLYIYSRDELLRQRPPLAGRISAYRGGYVADDRRSIERRLFSGELLGVAATNALELGIDVGHLDATVMVGYPGTIASTWQQAGRAGRGRRPALNVLIGYDDPLDQFYMRHPQELFGRPHEQALIDPQNPYILEGHLLCAAFEAPLSVEDEALFGADSAHLLAILAQEGIVEQKGDRWYYPANDYPAQRVNLRSASGEELLIVDEANAGHVLEQIDLATALFRVYPGGIYLHQGQSYLIKRLDLGRRLAVARVVEVDYYTQPRELNDVHIIRSYRHELLAQTVLFWGTVRVTEQVIGFRRKQQYTEQVLSEEPLDLPETTFETQALWFSVPQEIQAEVVHRGLDLAGGLHAVEHGCIGILPTLAMCDRNDIGGLSTPAHPDTGEAEIFIYDGHPGGVGLSERGFHVIRDLWQRTLETIQACPCEEGCPSCIQSPKCGNYNEPLDKAAAMLILERLLEC